MSHIANDQYLDSRREALLEMDYTGITKEYLEGRISMNDYDYLVAQIQSSCKHYKNKIVIEWIGGRGYVPVKICQDCFVRQTRI